MGIRQRLNQLQGRANQLMSKAEWTLDDAKEALRLGVELIQSVQAGVSAGFYLEERAIRKIGTQLLKGKGGFLPVRLTLDLDYSERPTKKAKFVGGSHDGKTYSLTDKQREHKSIVLAGNETYVWDGYVFNFDGVVVAQKLQE